MKTYGTKLIRRLATANLGSANVAIVTASAFVLVSAVSSLVVDRPAPSDALGTGWGLRGALTPVDPPPTGLPTHADAPKIRHFG